MLLSKCRFIWPSGFSGEDFKNSTNQKQELPVAAMFANELSSHYRGPSIDASYQVSVYLAKRFQRRIFLSRPIRNKYCLWRPCLLTDHDEISNRHRGPSIDASYRVSVHLARWF